MSTLLRDGRNDRLPAPPETRPRMRRVLMICYYFPPLGGIGSIRAVKFAAGLPQFGWEPKILTTQQGAFFEDQELTFREEGVVRTRSLELSRIGKRAMGLGGPTDRAPVTSGLNVLRRLVRRWLYCPDAQIGWYPFAVSMGLRTLRSQNVDAIFSSSFPITAHLVARHLQRASGLPWVAEFRDPWTQRTPYDSAARRRLDERIERDILTRASAVITVSRQWAALLGARAGKRVHVVTNGFEPADFPAVRPKPEHEIATYLGSYYPQEQDLRTALRAISRVVSSGLLPNLRLRFIGNRSAELVALVAECGLAERAEFTGFLSHRESLKRLCESTFCVLAGTPPDDRRRQVLRGILPAKMFEYLGARRPILYVGDLHSEAATLLRNVGGAHLAAAGDTDGACRAVAEIAAGATGADERKLVSYTRRTTTRRLAEVLDAVSEQR